MPERMCPRCRTRMTSGHLGPIQLEMCPVCHGFWFDCGELGQVTAAGPEVARRLIRPPAEPLPPPAGGVIGPPPCPACTVPMKGVEFAGMPGVRLETCQFCEGHWVTQQMVERLVLALEGHSEWSQIVRQHQGGGAAASPTPAPVDRPPSPITSSPPRVPTIPGGAPVETRRVLCVKCGEANPALAALCWACGHHFQGPAVGTCPRCEAGMRPVACQETTVSGCEGCGGAWLTPNRLKELLSQPYAHRNRMVQQLGQYRSERIRRIRPQLFCPHCGNPMTAAPLGNVSRQPVQSCGHCFSLFLDFCVGEEVLLRYAD